MGVKIFQVLTTIVSGIFLIIFHVVSFVVLLCVILAAIFGVFWLLDKLFCRGAMIKGISKWMDNETKMKDSRYVEFSFDQVKTIYELLESRIKETGSYYPRIELEHDLYVNNRGYQRGGAWFVDESYIIFPSVIDNTKYCYWKSGIQKNEDKRNTTESIRSHHSKDTYQNLINILQEEKERHQMELDKAIEEVRKTLGMDKEN